MTDSLYIGLMSGTSMDAVDAALIDIKKPDINTIATHAKPLPSELRQQILALTQPSENEIVRMGQLDNTIGQLFAETVNELLQKTSYKPSDIIAIGSHGQTIRHHPEPPLAFTLQIGNPSIISQQTGITTVADFRRRDIAAGGQGAPLVPALHAHLFRSADKNRVILNLGGIANITVLPGDLTLPIMGFDTGPANCLLDNHIQTHYPELFYDQAGQWAAQGKCQDDLLKAMLQEPYLQQPPPKSTGRELFHLDWLQQHLSLLNRIVAPVDIQTTLLEYTVITAANAIKQHAPNKSDVILCGGGSHNTFMVKRLGKHLPALNITSTAEYGIDPNYVEAIAFGWMAHSTLHRLPSNLPSVTGACAPVVLGGVYFA